jgi:hypothetical protein
LARESFRNAISKLQIIVYVILLVNHIHQAAQVRIRLGQNVSKPPLAAIQKHVGVVLARVPLRAIVRIR